jgi:acetylornithine deacetylase
MDLTLRVIGRKAHPGEAWRGVNAIQVTCRYIEALERLRIELDRDHMTPLWSLLPVGHVWGPMAINSGPRGSAIPDRCELVYNIGAIGWERMADLRATVEAALARVTASDDWLGGHPPEVKWPNRFYEPSTTDPTHPAVKAMIDAGTDLKEHPVAQALSAVTDARHLTNIAKIPAINFGPGDLHLCHSEEEMLRVEDLRRAVAWLALFMIRYCGAARGPSAPTAILGA